MNKQFGDWWLDNWAEEGLSGLTQTIAYEAWQAAQPKWEPIETAPVKGWFLAYDLKSTWRGNVPPVCIVKWDKESTNFKDALGTIRSNITHWMPKPDLPK